MVVVKCGDSEFYIDNKLSRSLDKVKKKVTKKDEDYFFAVDGEEGGGKSVLTLQLAKYVDHSFCLERIVFDSRQFQEAVIHAKKGQAIVFDEAFRGLSSRSALSEVNKVLVGLMMEIRQKNLFVFICMPTFFLLDKYVAIWRAKGLFHVYRRNGRRGSWVFFNRQKKKLLYLKGKATYTYREPRSTFKGRFTNYYTVDEKEYRLKKTHALQSVFKSVGADKIMRQRNLLLWYLHNDLGVAMDKIVFRMKELGWKTAKSSVHRNINKAHQVLQQKDLLE